MLRPKNIGKAFKQWNEVRRRAALKQASKPKKFGSSISHASKVKALLKQKEKKSVAKEATDPYFAFHEANARGKCENCGAPIPSWQRRHSQAHILPKRETYGFPSVAGHLDNHMELGVECGCHDLYDRSWSDAVKMKIFPVALQRFRLFQHLIAEEERSRIPECFTNAVIIKSRQIKTRSHYAATTQDSNKSHR